MRYLRIVTILLFVFSLLFAGWANHRYYSQLNTDYPCITSDVEELQISTQDPPEAMLTGLRATDATDGDLTDRIMVASVSHFLEPGVVRVKYVVFDDHNNSATITRRVRYTDYTPPVFILDKSPVYAVGNSFDLLKYIRVEDCLEGDISDRVRVISNMVNNYSVGTYPVVLEVSNSCGDTAQLQLWVTYLEKLPTANVALSQYIVYLEQGESFHPRQWITAVTDRHNTPLSADNVEVQGNLDVNTPGAYTLVYNYADSSRAGCSMMTVIVTAKEGEDGK